MNRWTVRAAWLVPLVRSCLHVGSSRSGAANAPIIFISQADYPGPEALIFTLGLTVSGVWQAWTVWAMTRSAPRPWSLERVVGLLAAGCVVAMANRSMYTHLDAHILAAMGIFTFGWVWLGLVQRRLRSSGATRACATEVGAVVRRHRLCGAISWGRHRPQVNPDLTLPGQRRPSVVDHRRAR